MSPVESQAPSDCSRCPFCGLDNRCDVNNAAPCWCFDTSVPAALLALLPDSQRGKRCVCFACVQAFKSDPEKFAANWNARQE